MLHTLPPLTNVQKLFHFDTPVNAYTCDAAVVDCFDQRFELVTQKYLQRHGIKTPDRIKLAGGIKQLAGNEVDPENSFIIQQLRTSSRLHGTRRVLLIAHSDCGAYGGLAAFNGDPDAEARHHWEQLQKAAGLIGRIMPELSVECYLLKFDGVWGIDSQLSSIRDQGQDLIVKVQAFTKSA